MVDQKLTTLEYLNIGASWIIQSSTAVYTSTLQIICDEDQFFFFKFLICDGLMLLKNTIRRYLKSGKKKTKNIQNPSPEFSLLDLIDVRGLCQIVMFLCLTLRYYAPLLANQ